MPRLRLSLILVFIGVLSTGCEPASTPESTAAEYSPQVPDDVLFRIKLESPDIANAEPGAHAFLCTVDGTAIILTAFHVAESLTRLPGAVDLLENRIRISSLQGGAASTPVGPRIALEGASANPSTDVGAFEPASRTTRTTLRLAPNNPEPGDTVWLFAEMNGDFAPESPLHPATVLVLDRVLAYVFHQDVVTPDSIRQRVAEEYASEFSSRIIALHYTSGSPVLNAKGEVVAIHAGAGNVDVVRLNVPGCCADWDGEMITGYGVRADSVLSIVRAGASG